MADKKHLNEFVTHEEYEEYISGDIPLSNVCLCDEEDEHHVHYHPWIGIIAKFKAEQAPSIYVDKFPQGCDDDRETSYQNLSGRDRYDYTGEMFEFDGEEYFLWEKYGDKPDEYDVKYLLTNTVDFRDENIEDDYHRGPFFGIYLNGDQEDTYTTYEEKSEQEIVAQRGGFFTFILGNYRTEADNPFKSMILDGIEQDDFVRTYTFNEVGECYVRYTLKDQTTLPQKMFDYSAYLLDEIKMSNTITSIGESAFSSSSLKSITIPNSVTSIGERAFSNTNLTSVTIPNSVTSIGERAFSNTNLTSVTIPNSVTTINDSLFSNCSSLTSVTIPESVTRIDEYAFNGCDNLTDIYIPSSVVSMYSNSFNGCSAVETIVVDAQNNTYDSRNNCNAIIKTNTNLLIQGCKNTVIPSDVITIGISAFYGIKTITSIGGVGSGADIEIPNSVTSIGSQAFGACKELTSVTIPNTVTNIGEWAFYGCGLLPVDGGIRYADTCLVVVTDKNLSSYTIKSNTRFIDTQSFLNCKNFTSITIPDNVIDINNYVFGGCDNLQTIVVDAQNNTYDSRDNCNAIIKTSINELIEGCKNTVIPSSVISIGVDSFKGRKTLTNITIPNTVRFLGSSCFNGCSGLTSVTLSNILTLIPSSAFQGCSGLTSVTIPNSVTTIGEEAFYGCSKLTSVIIPNSVTTIGDSAFQGCSKLASVTIEATTPPTLGEDVFKNNASGRKFYVPSASLADYKAASGWSEFKTSIYAIE